MATGVATSLSCEFGDGSADDIIEIVSAEEYDSQRAKLRASISWLSSKAYGKQVPRDFKDPFYENSEGQLMLRPTLVNLLSSSELYCVVCGKIFPETHTQWRGHWSIIQVLSRKGIYIADVSDTAVTETVLVQTAPFRLKAHLALMDALMRAYLSEVASVEKVAKAVRRFATFNASSDLPSNPEEALQFWVNKVGHTLGTSGSVGAPEEGRLIEGETNQKVRIVAKTSPSPRDCQQQQPTPRVVSVPPMEDLMRDIGDGCAIAAVIAYYRPSQLSLEDICLKAEIGIADSLYNLRQISIFCKSNLPWSSFHLTYEDFLYTHATMRVNLFTFVADLFSVFEAPVKTVAGGIDAVPAAGRKSGQAAMVPSVPISNATKKSFQKLPLEDTASNLGLTPQRSPAGTGSGHQPLLARRAAAAASMSSSIFLGGSEPPSSHQHPPPPSRRQGRRVQSLSTPQERDLVHRSVIAWQDDQKLSARSSTDGSPLLANVSIDSTMDNSLDVIEFEPGLSLELSGLDSPRVPTSQFTALPDRDHPDYMELESAQSSAHPSRRTPSSNTPHNNTTTTTTTPSGNASSLKKQQHQSENREGMEPLMPAVLRPTKEKAMSKAEERGDRMLRKRAVSSPLSPSGGSGGKDGGSTTSSWSDETCVTPLPVEASYHKDKGHSPGIPTSSPSKRHPQAFVVEDDGGGGLPLSSQSPLPSARSDGCSVAESYTVPDRPNTASDAIRAGIPIVSDMLDDGSSFSPGRGDPSREGSVASSGEYSDHESLKIHQDHKNRESSPMPQSRSVPENLSPDRTVRGDEKHQKEIIKMGLIMPDSSLSGGEVDVLGIKTAGQPNATTTNFAELKRLKDLKSQIPEQVDNSGLIYMQTGVYWDADGQPGGGGGQGQQTSSQGQQQGDGGGKSSVSFQSPPQTSWQQQPQTTINNGSGSGSSNGDVDGGAGDAGFGGGGGTASSELQQLRLKLEQKRKEIERKKHRKEAQQNKMRQRLGKAAFMRVVSKHMDGQEPDSEGDRVPAELNPNSTHAQLQARLGHHASGPRLPLSSSAVVPPPPSSSSAVTIPTQPLYLGGGPPPEQRLTDWSSQSQLAKANRNQQQQQHPPPPPSSQQTISAVAPSSSSLSQQQQPMDGNGVWNPNTNTNNYNTLPGQQSSSMTKTFSREGIQQTIDNIKNKWFRSDDSDLLLSASQHENDGDDDNDDAVDGDSSYSHHHHRRTPPTTNNRPTSYHHHQPSPPLATHSHTTPRSKSVCLPDELTSPNANHYSNSMPRPPSHPSLLQHQHQHHPQFDGSNTSPYYNNTNSHDDPYAMRNATRASSAPPVNIPAASRSSQGHHHMSEQDTSFEQLSCSLTDLQEEIMHMSLDKEQLQGTAGFNRDVVGMSDALAMIRGSGASSSTTTTPRPIHGIPNQAPYMHHVLAPKHGDPHPQPPHQLAHQKQPMVIGGSSGQSTAMPTTPTNVPYHNHSHPHPQVQQAMAPGTLGFQEEREDSTPTEEGSGDNTVPREGFFIAFGDQVQPRRPKPKLTDRSNCETPKKMMTSSATADSGLAATPAAAAAPPQGSAGSSASSTGSSSVAAQALDVVDSGARERSQSPHVGFVVAADPTDEQDKGGDSEMQKKKIKLLEMQRKRKEDQEKKRLGKEAVMARKQEEKQLKDEEAERKKADDKARRDLIFQQYMHKKNNEDEEGHPSPPVKARPERRSGSKPRPKSMFVKSKPMTPEPGAHGGRDSNSSSQEDLAARHGSPSLMSAMRSSYHFRAPGGKISMRKAVSCNTLPQNGSAAAGGGGSGASTYRRPPSPDLYRLRQQRQRGNSQDSGSETGSGSNPGSDYSGPKLFVKPSAKSNRHIIVNAISHCCLAGSVNTDTKNKVLQELSKCDANHFLILFRDASCKYRGLFIFYPETEEAFKVHGIGPKHITNDICEKFYKYNSGGKSFNEIVSTKHLSVSVDAVVLLGSVWKTGRATAGRR